MCRKNFSAGPKLTYKDMSQILEIFIVQKANKSIPQMDEYSFFACSWNGKALKEYLWVFA